MFPCDGYLQLAKELALKKDEASLRSAASRAYYASFHKIKLFAENNGTKFPGSKTFKIHGEVVQFLTGHRDPNMYHFGAELDRMRKDRNSCDYDDSVKNIKKTIENALISAEEIFVNII